jgi:hypothetical protein
VHPPLAALLLNGIRENILVVFALPLLHLIKLW